MPRILVRKAQPYIPVLAAIPRLLLQVVVTPPIMPRRWSSGSATPMACSLSWLWSVDASLSWSDRCLDKFSWNQWSSVITYTLIEAWFGMQPFLFHIANCLWTALLCKNLVLFMPSGRVIANVERSEDSWGWFGDLIMWRFRVLSPPFPVLSDSVLAACMTPDIDEQNFDRSRGHGSNCQNIPKCVRG